MLTYLSAVWAGAADPFWPHLFLLSATTIAAIAVGVGIVLEQPKYSPALLKVATWLVIGGVFVEALCSISLFVFDERISQAQQEKIIALEERTSQRLWTKQQFDAIQELKGSSVKDVAVIPEPHCLECSLLAGHLELALHLAGITLYQDSQPSGWQGTGLFLYSPPGSDLNNNPLANVLRKAGLYGGGTHTNPDFSPYKPDVWVIMVGEKYLPVFKFPFEPVVSTQWRYESLRK
jgi:hypothetical protein